MDARLLTLLALVGSCVAMSPTKSTTKDPNSSATAAAPVTGPAVNQFDTIMMRDSAVNSIQPNPSQQPSQAAGSPPYPSQQPPQGTGLPRYQPQQPPQGAGVPPYPSQQPPQGAGVPPYPSQQPPQGAGVQSYPPQQPPLGGSVSPNPPQQPPQGTGVPPYPSQQPPQGAGVPPYPSQQPPQGAGVPPYHFQQSPHNGGPQYSPRQPSQGVGVPRYGLHSPMVYGTYNPYSQQNHVFSAWGPTYTSQQTGYVAATNPTQQQVYNNQYQQYLLQQYNQLPYGRQTPTSNMNAAQPGRYRPTKPSFDVAKAKAYASQILTVNRFGGGDMMEQMNTMRGYGQNLARTSMYVKYEMNQFPSFGWWTNLPVGSAERQKAYWYLDQMMAAEIGGDLFFQGKGIQMASHPDKNIQFMANVDAASGLYGDRAKMLGTLYLNRVAFGR